MIQRDTRLAGLAAPLVLLGVTAGCTLIAVSMYLVSPFAPLIAVAGFWFLYLSVYSPVFLLLVFLVFMMGRLAEFFPILGTMAVGKVLMVATVTVFGLSKVFARDLTLVHTPHNRWFYLLVIAVVLSSAQGTNPAESFRSFQEGFIKVAVVFVLVTNLVVTVGQSVALQLCISLLGASLGTYALTASLLGYDPVTGAALVEGTRAGFQGALGDPNDLALVLLMGTPFLLIATIERRGALRLLFAALLCLSVEGIIATQSRGGLLGLTVCFGLVLSRYIKNKMVLAGLVAVFLIGIAAAAGISDRSSGGAAEEGIDASSQGRIDAWKAALNMAAHRPLLGVGFDRVVDNFLQYAINPSEPRPHTTHNTYLQCWGETGLLGFIPFMMLVYLSIKGGVQLNRQVPVGSHRLSDIVRRAALPGMAGVCVAAFFLSQAWTFFLYIMFAHIAANLNIASSEAEPPCFPGSCGSGARQIPQLTDAPDAR